MSEEPKKRTRGRIAFAVFVAYPLSAIPVELAAYWLCRHGHEELGAISVIYWPIYWLFSLLGR